MLGLIQLRCDSKIEQNNFEQESIPVGCVPFACQLHVLRWPPNASTSEGGGTVHQGPINKHEQVSSDGYQMSLVGGRAWGSHISHV